MSTLVSCMVLSDQFVALFGGDYGTFIGSLVEGSMLQGPSIEGF